MRRAVMAGLLLGWLGATHIVAQETAAPGPAPVAPPDAPFCPGPGTVPASEGQGSPCEDAGPTEPPPWQTVWGLVGLRAIPAGPKTAPNGVEYHPNFSIDLDFNFWLWRAEHLYLYSDARFWGEKGENGVTNGKDGFFGTSKRQFDLSGGVAWNYAGPWEARAFGYSMNNLNRGKNELTPSGINDGFGLENRFYLSPEYSRLGQTGFDVAKATFLSVGYYPSKTMVGNDGRPFKPGPMVRAYLTCNLWDWPAYVFGDATFIGERSFQAKLLLFDLGLAARPFSFCRQCEFRLGVENTADFQVHDVQNLWYVSFRYIF
jgi:hypothetical protein